MYLGSFKSMLWHKDVWVNIFEVMLRKGGKNEAGRMRLERRKRNIRVIFGQQGLIHGNIWKHMNILRRMSLRSNVYNSSQAGVFIY